MAGSTSRSSTDRSCSRAKGTPAEYKAGLELAIERGYLKLHESGTFVKFKEKGAALFA
jgi:hypothetical protein